jgi:carbonic anhydrase
MLRHSLAAEPTMSTSRVAATRRAVLALCLAGAVPAALAAADASWSYAGADGPDKWGSLDRDYAACAVGRQQSPVALTTATARDVANPQISYVPTDARVNYDGHTVQVDLRPGSSLVLDGVPYQLLQFHFHSPSEHTVDGQSFPVEVHLVHRSDGGALAVVGVLVTGGVDNRGLGAVTASMPTKAGKEVRLSDGYDPSALHPSDLRAFRYSGSLTTPPCLEGVTWVVLQTPIGASGTQIASFARLLQGNSRPPQPLNARELILDSSP